MECIFFAFSRVSAVYQEHPADDGRRGEKDPLIQVLASPEIADDHRNERIDVGVGCYQPDRQVAQRIEICGVGHYRAENYEVDKRPERLDIAIVDLAEIVQERAQ